MPLSKSDKIEVIGLGTGPDDLTPARLELIRRAETLVGGPKLLDLFPEATGRKIPLTSPLAPALEALAEARAQGRRTVVLCSGDPMFYGLGPLLVSKLGREAVRIHPNLSMVQVLAGRLGRSRRDWAVLSLHGRPFAGLGSALDQTGPTFVYTDPINNPAKLAAWLADRGQTGRRLVIAQNLGRTGEAIIELTAAGAADRDFIDPNVVLIEPDLTATGQGPFLMGNPDDAFDRDKGLLTKAPVRAAALSLMLLKPGLTCWDVGAGSGGLAVELSGLVRPGAVYALERRPDRVELIKTNGDRFGRDNLTVVQGQAPDDLADLPDPDRIFIGGGGIALAEIVARSIDRLKPGGLVVVSAVTVDSLYEALAAFKQAGLTPEADQIQVSRSKTIAGRPMFKPDNQVWLIRGIKE